MTIFYYGKIFLLMDDEAPCLKQLRKDSISY
mgnify:CR=1 FL=1